MEALLIAISSALGLLGGGGLVAWLGRNKTTAETDLLRAQTEQERVETMKLLLGQVGELSRQLTEAMKDLAATRLESAQCNHRYDLLLEKYSTVNARLDTIDAREGAINEQKIARAEAALLIETAKVAAEEVVSTAEHQKEA